MIRTLVSELYAALAGGDRDRVEAVLSPDFVAEFSAGLPAPIGGRHRGRDAIDHGWWEIGRRYRLRVQVDEQVETTDGRLLVLGHYLPIDAAFAHLWSAATMAGADTAAGADPTPGDARLTALVQITDTAIWLAEPTVGQPARH